MSLPGVDCAYWKVVRNSREIEEGKAVLTMAQWCSCTAQVRCDVVSFGTILYASYRSQAKRVMYACQAAVSVVRYVYTFRNFVSEFLQQSGTPPSPAWRHATLPLGNLPGFWYRRAIHQKNFSEVTTILATLIFWWKFLSNNHLTKVTASQIY